MSRKEVSARDPSTPELAPAIRRFCADRFAVRVRVPSLLISGWFMGFVNAGVIIYYGRKVQSTAWIAGFALAPFSAVYYPLDILPGWARAVASALPMYIFEGMRKSSAAARCP